jgi:hypothetical protein
VFFSLGILFDRLNTENDRRMIAYESWKNERHFTICLGNRFYWGSCPRDLLAYMMSLVITE